MSILFEYPNSPTICMQAIAINCHANLFVLSEQEAGGGRLRDGVEPEADFGGRGAARV